MVLRESPLLRVTVTRGDVTGVVVLRGSQLLGVTVIRGCIYWGT